MMDGKIGESESSETLVNGFAKLGLSVGILDVLNKLDYHVPTPIQSESIPHLLAGKDLIGLAATGTGKTAAFTLPVVQRIASMPKPRKAPTCLILTPTRELAMQVAAAVDKYGKALGVTVTAVFGGAGFNDQVRMIRRGVDVIVATPGRALDHIRRGTLDLSTIQAAVLDEADEMLDMGFADDLEAILGATPKERQTMLFSATMPPRIVAIAEKHLKNPVRIQIAKAVTLPGEAPKVRETCYVVQRDHKPAAVARLLEYEQPASSIVFCRTRHEADSLADDLNNRGYRPESLHGGMSQEQRDRVMKKFRSGSVNLLIATDVAARGLDINQLSHVINYHVPETPETYVHRIGRVGRAGREGVAITISEPRESNLLRNVERITKRRINQERIPNAADLQAKRLERTRDAVKAAAMEGGLDEYKSILEPLIGEFTIVDLALAAVKIANTAGRPDDDDRDIPTPMSRDNGPRRSGPPMGDRDFGPRRSGPPMGGPGGPPRAFTGPGRPAAPSTPIRGMARLFVSAGRDVGLNRRDLVNAIESEVGLGSRDVGNIEIAERFSLIDVPMEAAESAVESLNGIRLKGRKVTVRRDRAPANGDFMPG